MSTERQDATLTYDYTDLQGVVVSQAWQNGDQRLRHRTRLSTGVAGTTGTDETWTPGLPEHPVLYRLPQVAEAVALERDVFIVPNEACVEDLESLGFVATTCPGGLWKWHDHFAEVLAGAAVVILASSEIAPVEQIAAACAAAGARVRLVESQDDGWYTRDEIVALVAAAPLWTQDPRAKTRWTLAELWANEEMMRPAPAIVPRLCYAGRSTLLAAREKSGKSTLAGYLAAQVSVGGDFLGDPCNTGQPGNVLIVGLEEFTGDTARRLKEFGADGFRVHVVTHFLGMHMRRDPGSFGRVPSLPSGVTPLQEVRSHIEAVAPVLTVIDTLMAYCGDAITDANAASQMQPIVQPLTDLAHATGTALYLAHHAKKSGGGYSNSYIIGGGVDVIAEIDVPDEENDPTLRAAKVVGRGGIGHHKFGFRYDEHQHRYYADQGFGKEPLDKRILTFVRANPRCSLRTLRGGVGGRAEDVDAMARRLVNAGELIHDSDERRQNVFTVPGYV